MRVVILAAVVTLAFVGCFLGTDLDLVFDNRTDSLLCFYLSPESAIRGSHCDEVKPNQESVWAPGCGDGWGADRNPITVVLTDGQGGPLIYEETALCREWKEAGERITIQQSGDAFVVTDNLP